MAQPFRALLYIRESGHGSDSLSIDIQERACGQYAEMSGWTVAGTIVERATSGSRRGKRLARLGIQQVREAWETGACDVVIFYNISRVARSVLDFHRLVEEAERHGAALVSVQERLDLTTPQGRFGATILAAFAEMEAEIIRARFQSGKDAASARGRWIGGAVPFGFRPVELEGGGKRLEPVERESQVLHHLVGMLAAGESWHALVRWMNRDSGVTPRRARAWSYQTVRKIVSSQAAQTLLFDATQRRTVRTRLEVKSGGSPGRAPAALLSTLLRCGLCGSMLAATSRGTRRAGYTPIYRCNGRTQGVDCPGVSIARHLLDGAVERVFLESWGGQAETRAVRAQDTTDADLAAVDEDIEDARFVLTSSDREARALALRRLEKLEDRRDELLSRPQTGALVLQETGRTLREVWGSVDLSERREMIRGVVGTMTVLPGGKALPARYDPLTRLDPGSRAALLREDG